ncbi:MAG: EutN/CcmL family microcompartment protein [Bryobacteraceae bacterium]|nr:EutN/CcmL family microcompartment protein [Bryobacteraceae bacterium]
MTLGRVVGSIVATRKDPRLEGHTLLIVKPVSPEGQEQPGYQVAVDTVGAGNHELVLTVAGSSARMALGSQDKPVDCVIVGIVDGVSMGSAR